MYGYIYKITDKKTNKIYIGQHKSETFDESYWGSGNIIRRILRKDGKLRLTREVLCECDSREDLDNKEKYYISIYDAQNFAVGYNLHPGGTAPGPVKDKEAASKNMSKAKLGNTNAAGNAGMLWVHKDGIQTKVHPDVYDSYIANGWLHGMLGHSEEDLKNIKDKYANGTYITDGSSTQFVSYEELQSYLDKGWTEGRAPFSDTRNAKLKKSKSGTIEITDGIKRYYIKPEKWPEYEQKGGYYKCSLYKYNQLNSK